MGNRTFYEWKIEEVDNETDDILAAHHFRLTKEAVEWFRDVKPDDGCHYNVCIVRDIASIPAGQDSTSPEACLKYREHFYVVMNGFRFKDTLDEYGAIKERKLPKYMQDEVNSFLEATV